MASLCRGSLVMSDVAAVLDILGRWGYVLVFLAATLEALPFVGLLVPGQAVVIVAAFFAAQGHFSVGVIFACALVAGVIGDAVGYALGRRFGRDLILRYGPRFRIESRHVARADALFDRYGPLALVLARFSFLTRGIGPLLAGVTRMRASLFWVLNVVGAIAWAGAYTALGYAFGEAVLVLEGVVGRFILIGFGAAVGVTVLYWLLRKANRQFTREDAWFAALAVLAIVAFARLAQLVSDEGRAPLAIDGAQPAIADALSSTLPLWRAVSFAGSRYVVGPAVLALFLLLAWRKRWGEAVLFGFGVGGSELVVSTLKVLFARARPDFGVEDLTDFSFPSGHASAIVVLAGGVVYVTVRRLRARTLAGGAVVAAATVVVAAMGTSRVAVRAHYPSDVLGGFLVGAAWLFTLLLVVEYIVKRAPSASGLESDVAGPPGR